jgi:hypothetical protein
MQILLNKQCEYFCKHGNRKTGIPGISGIPEISKIPSIFLKLLLHMKNWFLLEFSGQIMEFQEY